MTLVAFGLIKIPLIGSLGFLQHRLVLEQHGLVLGVAALIADDRAYRSQDRGEDRDISGKTVSALGLVFHRMVVGAVNMKSF